MLIQIISGTYGYMFDGRVQPKTPTDKPFDVSSREAQRLFSLGVAEPADKADGRIQASTQPDDSSEGYGLENTKSELLAILEQTGIRPPAGANKEKLVELLDEYYGENGADSDEAPQLTAQAPVED